MSEWTNTQLVEWMDSNQFEDYSRIVKYNEWTGFEFTQLTQNKAFMKETLGLTREDLLIKMSTDISNALTGTQKSQILYGWGKNDFGQLGAPISSNLQMAMNIPLPKLHHSDEIVKIECGWKNSAILTKKGNIYITELQHKQQKVQEVKNEEQK